MRAWYVDRRNEPVLDVRMMVIFGCALVLVLVWLLPREAFFRQMLAEGEADHVSIAYARLLTALNPADDELHQLLAAQYLTIGELELAWAQTGAEQGAPSLLRVRILEQLVHGGGPDRGHWAALLLQELHRTMDVVALDDTAITELTRAAYALERPDVAAGYFQRRFLETRTEEDLLLAAAAWEAADQADSAGALFRTLSAAELQVLSPMAVKRGVEIFLAAGRFDDGFAFIDGVMARGWVPQDLAMAFVTFAERADAPERAAAYLALIDEEAGLTNGELTQLAAVAVAAGELDFAARMYERLLDQHSADTDTRLELARIYRWSGQPELALDQWIELVDRTDLDSHRISAWKLARSLYRYDVAAGMLGELSRSRRLSDEEINALRESYELQGLPDDGIRVIRSYVDRHPRHRQAWLALIGLEQANEYLVAASASWAGFARYHEPDVKERLRWADLLWEQYRTEEAVALLLAQEHTDHAEYWQRLATYAWFLDDMRLVARAYQAMIALGRLEEDHFERFLAAVMISDRSAVSGWARYGWETYADPHYLVQALQWATAESDEQSLGSLIELAEAEQTHLAHSAEYWEVLAYYHTRRGELEAARTVLTAGLHHHPERVSLIAPYLWILIQTDTSEVLTSALEQYEDVAVGAGDLWSAYGSGYARLNQHAVALGWYTRAVDVTPEDLGLLLSYAHSLDMLGLADPAYRVRRHVIAELAAGRISPDISSGMDLSSISDAGRGVLTADQQQLLAHQLVAGSDDGFRAEQLPGLYLAQALARSHYTAAGYWLERSANPDAWQRLSVAAERHDAQTLEAMLDHSDPLIRINAALALDRPELAYDQPGTTLLDEDERLGLAKAYYNRFPTGWQIAPEQSRISALNVDSLSLYGAGRVGAYGLRGEIRAFHLSDELRLIPGEVDEWLVGLEAERSNGLGEFSAGVTLLDSSDELIPGFLLSQTLSINRHHTLQLGAGYQQLTEITALARAVSQRSGLDIGWQSLLGRRDRLTMTMHLDHYQDRFGDALGQGGRFQARFDHAWKLSGPQVLVGASFYMTKNTTEGFGDDLLSRLLIDRGELLLPEETGRLALNASISRGSPGTLNWERPSPRYRIGAAVGYQWPESAPTLEFEASLGVRVFGNDELSFRAAYTSALLSAVGGDGYRATLIYSKRLGR